MKKMNNKGFSLVELIVVIAIMAVLVGVLAPQFIKYVENSKQSTDMQNVQQMKTAIEVAVADGSISAPQTIKVNDSSNGKITTEANITSCAKEISLKSEGWNSGSYSYSSTYTWDASAGCGANTKGENKNMNTIFE